MPIREPIAALTLEPSETAVLEAASRIFSALIVAGRLGEENQGELVEFSIRAAVALAREADRAIESDHEVVTRSNFGG